jgi:hypothetical protein
MPRAVRRGEKAHGGLATWESLPWDSFDDKLSQTQTQQHTSALNSLLGISITVLMH